ncbi:MAG: hypothetical protein VX026_00785 [Myxococcota bacterium]|nr:hypothetical protein [Myxococcota bacterium]
MIAIILLMGQAIAATLLDTTYGVVGRNVEVLDGAEQAYALVDQQDWSAAAQEWIAFGKANPASEETSRLWAVSCLIRAEDYGEAVHQMKISQTVDRMDLRLGLLMSWIEVETGVYAEAYRLAQLYPTQALDAEGAKLLQLRALFEGRKYRKHKRLVRKFIEAGSTDAWFWFDVGQSAVQYHEPALGYFEQAVKMDDSAPIHYQRLLQHIESSDIRAVLRYAPDAVKKFPQDPQILSLVEGYAEDELLLDAFKSAADASPEHGKIQWLTAILFDTKERYQQSSKYFRAALDAGEDHIHIYHQLSDNLQQLGEHSRVQAVLLEGIEKHPESETLIESAVAHSDEPSSSLILLDRFEEVWRQNPQNPIANAGFQVSRRLRKWSLALKWAEREAELNPESVSSILHQGVALHALNRWEEVIVLYHGALVRHPASHSILNNLAWSYTQSKSSSVELDDALELAQQAIALSNGQNAAYFDTLAQIYWKQGKKGAAVKAIQHAVSIKPESVLYQKRLQEYTGE